MINSLNKQSKNLLLRIDKRQLYSHEIVSLVANINYTYVYLSSGSVLIVSKTLKSFEIELTKIGFIRIHKSAIINPHYICKYSHPEMQLSNGQVVTVSRRRKLE